VIPCVCGVCVCVCGQAVETIHGQRAALSDHAGVAEEVRDMAQKVQVLQVGSFSFSFALNGCAFKESMLLQALCEWRG
jgi:hypothetical protein